MDYSTDNIIVITRYADLTAETMVKLLKSGLNDFEFGFYKKGDVEVPNSRDIRDIIVSIAKYMSKESHVLKLSDFNDGNCEKYLDKAVMDYYESNMALVYEYIARVEKQELSVGEIRLANRGLEGLMWYRDEIARNSDVIENISFHDYLLKEDLNDAASSMYDNVVYLVKKANCEKLWIHTDWKTKAELVKKWGYTMMTDPEDMYDENSTFPYTSKRELRLFENVMGRDFEEFDSILR